MYVLKCFYLGKQFCLICTYVKRAIEASLLNLLFIVNFRKFYLSIILFKDIRHIQICKPRYLCFDKVNWSFCINRNHSSHIDWKTHKHYSTYYNLGKIRELLTKLKSIGK